MSAFTFKIVFKQVLIACGHRILVEKEAYVHTVDAKQWIESIHNSVVKVTSENWNVGLQVLLDQRGA